jgi:hypothetical protein
MCATVRLSVSMPTDDPDDNTWLATGAAIEVMYLDTAWLRYAWLEGERCHLHEVARIEAGDDGAVLVHAVGPMGMVLAITRASQVQVERLALRRKQVLAGERYATRLEGGITGAVVFGQAAAKPENAPS